MGHTTYPRRRFFQLTLLGATALGCEEKVPTTCPATAPLDARQLELRKKLAYVDAAASPQKRCTACTYYLPSQADHPCGGCTSLPGPIHPLGTCNLFRAIS